MPTISVRLDPSKLDNPDLDIRYLLPDRIAAKSSGFVTDDGYDYAGNVPYIVVYLKTEDVDRGMAWVVDTIENERILGNDLRQAAVVAVEREGRSVVAYPRSFEGTFPA